MEQNEESRRRELSNAQLADDLYTMLDTDKDQLIKKPLAMKQLKNWVPSKMSQETAKTYWNVLSGTEKRYGCVKRAGKKLNCFIGYDDVAQYIKDEDYLKDSTSGLWTP